LFAIILNNDYPLDANDSYLHILMQASTSNFTVTSSQNFVIRTQTNTWNIPHNCRLLRLLLEQQKIKSDDLRFESSRDCEQFIKQLFLLSLEDEIQTHKPSPLAKLARRLLQNQSIQN